MGVSGGCNHSLLCVSVTEYPGGSAQGSTPLVVKGQIRCLQVHMVLLSINVMVPCAVSKS